MKLFHYPDADSLYIELSPVSGAVSHRVAEGVTLEMTADGQVVAIDIDSASRSVDLDSLEAYGIPQRR